MAYEDLQARVANDPIYQAALRQYAADNQQWQMEQNRLRLTDPLHHAKMAGDDPALHAAMLKYSQAIAQSPLTQELANQNLQVNWGTGQLERRDPAISPTMLALLIGGGLTGAGLLSGGAGGAGAAPEFAQTSSPLAGVAAPSLTGTVNAAAGGAALPAVAAPAAAASGSAAAAGSSPSLLMKALAGVGGLVGGNVAGRLGANAAVPPQLSDLLDIMSQRAKAQTPVFNAVQQGTWTGLPNYATQGLTPPKAVP